MDIAGCGIRILYPASLLAGVALPRISFPKAGIRIAKPGFWSHPNSYVESEQDDISLLDYVVFPFQAEHAFVPGRRE